MVPTLMSVPSPDTRQRARSMKRPFTNNTPHTVYVDGKLLRPGVTRMVDETTHPDYRSAAVQRTTAAPVDELLTLLDKTVPQIIPLLHGLNSADLTRLEQAESNGNTRKGVMAAITEERLRQAAADETNEQRLDLQISLVEMTDSELDEQLEEYADDPAALIHVHAEMTRRADHQGAE